MLTQISNCNYGKIIRYRYRCTGCLKKMYPICFANIFGNNQRRVKNHTPIDRACLGDLLTCGLICLSALSHSHQPVSQMSTIFWFIPFPFHTISNRRLHMTFVWPWPKCNCWPTIWCRISSWIVWCHSHCRPIKTVASRAIWSDPCCLAIFLPFWPPNDVTGHRKGST